MSTLAGMFFAFNILYLSETGIEPIQIVLVMLIQAGFGMMCYFANERR